MRRTAALLALALVAIAGSTGPATAAGAAASPVRAFTGDGISFRYPQAWKRSPPAWKWTSTAAALVTYLSTDTMHDPCVRSTGSETCAPPLGALAPGGVLVTWTRGGLPGQTLGAGTRTRLAGRTARIGTARPGACRYLHADETITARIATGPGPAELVLQACLRGPETAANAARVRAMLATLKVS